MDRQDQFSHHAAAVAREILGEENKKLSDKRNLRWGTGGSVSLDIQKGAFYDHENNEGGGVLWFIESQTGQTVDGGNAVKWMRDHAFDVEDLGDRFGGYGQASTGPDRRDDHMSERDRKPQHRDADGNWIPDRIPDGTPVSAVHEYLDANGGLAYQVVRYDWPDPAKDKGRDKTFMQRTPDPRNPGQWRYKNKGAAALPYRLPELIEDIADGLPVYIVEGEKKVDMMRDRLGVAATCNHGGAGKFYADHAKWLAGADVVIIPDNDDAGRKHADEVGAALHGKARSIAILDLPDLPPKGSVDDWIPAGGTAEKLAQLRADSAVRWRPKPPDSQFGAVTWLDMWNKGPELKPLIKGVMTQNEIALLVGPSQSGKSFLAVDLAMAVARGCNWFGRKVSKGLVIYQAGESAAGLRRRRLPAYAQHQGVDDQPLPFVLLQNQIDLFNGDEHAHALAKECKAHAAAHDAPLRLIVIDTFARATPGANENDGRDMGAIVERCEFIRRETGATVLLVHHMNAGGTKARGHTSLFAAVDSTINCRKVEEIQDANGRQVREWSLSKMKEGEDGITERFVLPRHVLGHDEDGDEISSCIVARPTGIDDDGRGDDGAISVQGKTAVLLRALYQVVEAQGEPAPADLDLPSHVRVVTRAALSARLREVMSIPDDELEIPKGDDLQSARRRFNEANRKSAERARDTLFKNQVIGLSEEHVWLTGKPVKGFGPPPGTPRRSKAPEDAAPPIDDSELPFDMGDFDE